MGNGRFKESLSAITNFKKLPSRTSQEEDIQLLNRLTFLLAEVPDPTQMYMIPTYGDLNRFFLKYLEWYNKMKKALP